MAEEAIERLLQIVALFPDAPLTVERRAASVVVTPTIPDSFAVALYDEGGQAMVAAERWHAHEDDPEQAAFAAYWLLTPFYRIVHELKGGVLAAIWVERYEATGWEAADPVFFMNPEHEDDWRPQPGGTYARKVIQQAVLPSLRPYGEVAPGAMLDERGWPQGTRLGVHVSYVPRLIGHELF